MSEAEENRRRGIGYSWIFKIDPQKCTRLMTARSARESAEGMQPIDKWQFEVWGRHVTAYLDRDF